MNKLLITLKNLLIPLGLLMQVIGFIYMFENVDPFIYVSIIITFVITFLYGTINGREMFRETENP